MKIAHISDIHIRKSTLRHQEYREVFDNLYKSVSSKKPDIIVIAGDLFHDGIKFESEQIVLAAEFLDNLSKIAPVRITRGNHDLVKYSLKRLDAIDAILKIAKNKNVLYLDDTLAYKEPRFPNIVWMVWHHAQKNNNPWLSKGFVRDESKTYIDLFHDPVNGAKSPDNYTFNSKTYYNIGQFQGDMGMFGDIHSFQELAPGKAYSSSLIEQNFGEGDDQFHGYLLWDVETRTFEKVPVFNRYSFKNVVVTQLTDFDDLDFNIENMTEFMRIRVIWKTYPAQKNADNERKVVKHLQDKYKAISVKHKTEFLEDKKNKATRKNDLLNLSQKEVVHEIIREHLDTQGVEQDVIDAVVDLDQEIEGRVIFDEINNIQWSVMRFSGEYFRSYKKLEINWDSKDGIYQIQGKNTAGKSTIIQILSYILYGKTLETDYRKKFGDARFVNNIIDTDYCQGETVLECSGEYYGIRRRTQLKKNRAGELTEAKTTVNYFKLATGSEELNDQTNIENLNEEERRRTQKRIDEIIGSYENFIRIVLTTSDTLNKILSADKSEFIDSVLADAGMNVFDQRLTGFKEYKKEIIKSGRISCDVLATEGTINLLNEQINEAGKKINEAGVEIDKVKESIKKGQEFKEKTIKTFHKINVDNNLTEEICNKRILEIDKEIALLEIDEKKLKANIEALPASFNEDKLLELNNTKEAHTSNQFALKNKINTIKIDIERNNSKIQKLNGDVHMCMRDGKAKKEDVVRLEGEKICSRCGQEVKEEALATIKENIAKLKKEMFELADLISAKNAEKKEIISANDILTASIETIEETIRTNDINFSEVLLLIADLKAEELKVKKRKEYEAQLPIFPVRIENRKLEREKAVRQLQELIDNREKIEQNKKIQLIVDKANTRLEELNRELNNWQSLIGTYETNIKYNQMQIKAKQELIVKFKEQEKQDRVFELYHNCVHREGIPTQILRTIIIPRINDELNAILANVEFSVWLDSEELRPKMAYNTRPDAVIDCVTSSGKERTFSALSLKTALNEINAKSKPTMILLDEVTGKLDNDGSVDEFIELLQILKKKAKKLIIIEHNHQLNPDYILDVEKDDKGVSTLRLL